MPIYDVNGNSLSAVYSADGLELQAAYDVNGEEIFSKGSPSIDYSRYSIENYCAVSLSPTQGFDIFNGTIFQFLANSSISNRMATINANSKQIINNNISASSDHGDSASFSSEFYAEGDTFPLLYVTADTNPAKVYVNRVTQTSSQLVKTFVFPLEKTGYYAALCLDEASRTMYMVGYSENNYQTDGGGTNKAVISKWDMSNMTDNGDGTYTPLFVSSFERPFIYVMQGQQFHDGMLWIASGGTNARGYIYALNPSNGNLLFTVDTGTTTELEGLSFISDSEMVFGLQGGTYKKVSFEQA